MRGIARLAGLAAALFVVASARADLTFSNVSITGSLSSGASFNTGAQDIDFSFPSASVGDALSLRTGDLVIEFDAESTTAVDQDSLILSVLGALGGSGTISFSEIVEDLDTAAEIANYNVVLDDNAQLPHTATIDFTATASRIHVTKQIELNAPDTAAFDLSNLSVIEQVFREVPEPASVLLVLAGLVTLRRR